MIPAQQGFGQIAAPPAPQMMMAPMGMMAPADDVPPPMPAKPAGLGAGGGGGGGDGFAVAGFGAIGAVQQQTTAPPAPAVQQAPIPAAPPAPVAQMSPPATPVAPAPIAAMGSPMASPATSPNTTEVMNFGMVNIVTEAQPGGNPQGLPGLAAPGAPAPVQLMNTGLAQPGPAPMAPPRSIKPAEPVVSPPVAPPRSVKPTEPAVALQSVKPVEPAVVTPQSTKQQPAPMMLNALASMPPPRPKQSMTASRVRTNMYMSTKPPTMSTKPPAMSRRPPTLPARAPTAQPRAQTVAKVTTTALPDAPAEEVEENNAEQKLGKYGRVAYAGGFLEGRALVEKDKWKKSKTGRFRLASEAARYLPKFTSPKPAVAQYHFDGRDRATAKPIVIPNKRTTKTERELARVKAEEDRKARNQERLRQLRVGGTQSRTPPNRWLGSRAVRQSSRTRARTRTRGGTQESARTRTRGGTQESDVSKRSSASSESTSGARMLLARVVRKASGSKDDAARQTKNPRFQRAEQDQELERLRAEMAELERKQVELKQQLEQEEGMLAKEEERRKEIERQEEERRRQEALEREHEKRLAEARLAKQREKERLEELEKERTRIEGEIQRQRQQAEETKQRIEAARKKREEQVRQDRARQEAIDAEQRRRAEEEKMKQEMYFKRKQLEHQKQVLEEERRRRTIAKREFARQEYTLKKQATLHQNSALQVRQRLQQLKVPPKPKARAQTDAEMQDELDRKMQMFKEREQELNRLKALVASQER